MNAPGRKFQSQNREAGLQLQVVYLRFPDKLRHLRHCSCCHGLVRIDDPVASVTGQIREVGTLRHA